MFILEWRDAGEVLVVEGVAEYVELVDGGVEVAGGPEHVGVDGEAEEAELVFLAFTIFLAEFASLAVDDFAGESVAGFLDGELFGHRAPIAVVVGIADSARRCKVLAMRP